MTTTKTPGPFTVEPAGRGLYTVGVAMFNNHRQAKAHAKAMNAAYAALEEAHTLLSALSLPGLTRIREARALVEREAAQ